MSVHGPSPPYRIHLYAPYIAPGTTFIATIKERKSIQTLHGCPYGTEIRGCKRLFLRGKLNRRQYHMLLYNAELIEDEVMRPMQLRNKEIVLEIFCGKRISKGFKL